MTLTLARAYWTCDCQSARVRRKAGEDATAGTDEPCPWCGRSRQQVNDDARTRRNA